MEFQKLCPCVRFAMAARLHTYPREVLAYDHRLFYCAEKAFAVSADGISYAVSPGDMLFLPPAVRYRLDGCEGEYPVLLLDDVLSELDSARQEFVLNRIGGGQTLVSCCEAASVERMTGGRVLYMDKGRVNEACTSI